MSKKKESGKQGSRGRDALTANLFGGVCMEYMDHMEFPLNGYIFRIVYEMTMGDVLTVSGIAALILLYILDAIRKTLWRR